VTPEREPVLFSEVATAITLEKLVRKKGGLLFVDTHNRLRLFSYSSFPPDLKAQVKKYYKAMTWLLKMRATVPGEEKV
jgi:hypothetical protein